ncbi:MAG: toll/interleukin-1 receptor domain-containing protein [candidate division Zixibacteria bacterium]|nr:toll/interleukin-1 receptor domain-containing protein [candidate division Zixibacteria bacterium]
MAFSTFISYSTRDLPLANQTKVLLEQSGSHVFLAEYSVLPGSGLSAEIIRAIKNCDLFLLLWSRNSQSSEWVPQEIGIAKGADKPILPVVLDSSAKLQGFLKDLKYLPYYEDPGKALAWLHQNVFSRVKKKEQTDGLLWLGIGTAVIWLVAQRE